MLPASLRTAMSSYFNVTVHITDQLLDAGTEDVIAGDEPSFSRSV